MEFGRHEGFRYPCLLWREGSSPSVGTMKLSYAQKCPFCSCFYCSKKTGNDGVFLQCDNCSCVYPKHENATDIKNISKYIRYKFKLGDYALEPNIESC